MIRLRRPTSRFLIAATALAAASPHAALLAQQAHTPPALDVAGMDRSVKPGDNFFEFANGTWLKQTEIPADRSSYGASAMLIELTDRRVADLIQEAAKGNAPAGSDLRKIGDYYTSFMDTVAIDAAGLKPLQPALDSIAAIRDRKDLARVLGSGLRADVDAINATNFYTENLFGLWVAQDLDDPTHYSPFLLQGGLGMPDRSYYVDSSAAMATIRAKYQEHIAAMLRLANIPDAETKAAAIARLETSMAGAHASREESGDVTKGNNHWKRADFGSKAPGLDWETYFAAAGLGKPATFVVWQPGAVTGLSALVASEPLDTWKDYLTFHAIDSHAAPAPRRLRPGGLLVLRPGAERRPEAAGPLEARRQRHQRRARLRRRQALHRALLPGRREGAGPGHGGQLMAAFAGPHRPAGLDGAGHEEGGQGQARRAQGRRRLSRQVADYSGLEIVKVTPTATPSVPSSSSSVRTWPSWARR